MEINDLEIDLQDCAGNNDNKALTMVPLSDKEMSTVIGGNNPNWTLPNPTPTHSEAPPAVPHPKPRPKPRSWQRSERRVRLGRVWAI